MKITMEILASLRDHWKMEDVPSVCRRDWMADMGTKLVIACLCYFLFTANEATGSDDVCDISPQLRDKWLFHGMEAASFMRVRKHVLIYVNKGQNAEVKRIRYKCLERRGNTYLFRTFRKQKHTKKRGVLCLGFSYLGLSPHVEYGMLRLNSNGGSFSLISPKPTSHKANVSIERSCDLLLSSREVFAYIRRADSGCRFRSPLWGEWVYTYFRVLSVTFSRRSMTYRFVNNSTMTLTCDKRDGDNYLLRLNDIKNSTQDAIVCFEVTAVSGFYDYKVMRLNSGDWFDNRFRLIPRGKPAHIHQDCDWIESPGRPEYLYHA